MRATCRMHSSDVPSVPISRQMNEVAVTREISSPQARSVTDSPTPRLKEFVAADALDARERPWHRLVLSLDAYPRWNFAPDDLRDALLREAQAELSEAMKELGVARRDSAYPQDGVAPWLVSKAPNAKRELFPSDPVTAAWVVADGLTVIDSRVRRWKDGEPGRGRPRAGDATSLRLGRMLRRLREEGSAEAVRDRRSLPADILLPGGHGRRYLRHSRPAPSATLLALSARVERERTRVFREAEWASLRLQGLGVRGIADLVGVAPSTVSETPAVRLADSLRRTALELLSVESVDKARRARQIGLDPQQLQRAARRLEAEARAEPEPPDDASVAGQGVWDLSEHGLGLLSGGPPTLGELVVGLTPERADQFGKLLQLVADASAGREPTMHFRVEPERAAPTVHAEALIRQFGGRRYRLNDVAEPH